MMMERLVISGGAAMQVQDAHGIGGDDFAEEK
jgi:hypothetical protein